jgi:sugar-specific transcriptional regulator TrmB
MAADAKLEIVLTAKDAASQVINHATQNIQSQLTGLQQRAAQLTSTFIKVSAAAVAASQVWGELKSGAKAIEQQQAFESLAASYGKSADEIVSSLKKASAETVDTMTLINKAGTAMMMGIDPGKLNKLMEIARATARMTGQEMTQAFSDIALAVGRQSKMILDNLGIIISVEKANDDYAKTLNKTATELTDTERRQAFLTATIKAGDEIVRRMGDTHRRTAAEMFQSWEAMSSNFREIAAKGIVSSVQYIVVTLSLAQSTITQTLENIAQGWSYLFGFIGKLPGGELLGFKALSEELQGIATFLNTARMNAYGFIDEMLRLNEPVKKLSPIIPVAPGQRPGQDNKVALREYNDLLREAARLQQEAIDSLRPLQTQATSTWELMNDWLERNNEAEKEAIALTQQWHDEAVRSLGDISSVNMAARLEEALADPDSYFGKITNGAKAMSEELKDAITGWANGFSKTLSDIVWDSETSFSDIAESFGRMLTQMSMQRFIVTPFLDWFGGLFPSAQGNVFASGNLLAYGKGGVIKKPTVFPFASGIGLMGESGPEAIMPLTRLPSGDLGVKAKGGNAAPNVKINVMNNTGQQAQVRQSGPTWNGQEWVIGVWLDAYHRNVGGLRSALGV